MNKKEIGDRIKKSLECKGMSQRQLADSLDMTETTISRYVKGKRIPSAEILGRIADVLGVTTDYLITGKTEPTKHVEMIVDYLVDGDDYMYSDNRGVLIRCRDCKRWNANMKNCAINSGVWERNDYCSKGGET